MARIPDSPEGVALALSYLILGVNDSLADRAAISEEEVLRVYRRCLAATRPYDVPDPGAQSPALAKVGCH